MDLVESRRIYQRRMNRLAKACMFVLILAIGSFIAWVYSDYSQAATKINVLMCLLLGSSCWAVLWRRAFAAIGFQRLLREDCLASMRQIDFPKESQFHSDIESFLESVGQMSGIAMDVRFFAARWLGQIQRTRQQFDFANIEMDALNEAFDDYKRLSISGKL
jgi:predicted membrane protein